MEVIFCLGGLMVTVAIVGLADRLMDYFGLEEDYSMDYLKH